KISADGSKLLYSSFLGGGGRDTGYAIAVDSAGNAYVAGGTIGGVFPVVAPLQPQPVNPYAASFLTKVDPTGSKLVYSTLVAASSYSTPDTATALVIDSQGRPVVGGITEDASFALVDPIQPTIKVGAGFIARFSASGSALDFSTYLGGLNADNINSLAAGPD